MNNVAAAKDSEIIKVSTYHHSHGIRRNPLMRKRSHSLVANMIPFHERHSTEFATIICGGSALAFNSGFINGCTLLTPHPQPVSHVTGTTSHAGINLALGNYDAFGIQMTVILCFIFGSSITGYWMPANSFQLGRQYGPLFLIGSVLLSLACITSTMTPESNFYFYFASMASGLQNGMTTKYSGSIIRTTHLTGAATDIGLVLGRVAMGDKKDVWKLQVLLPIALSFFTGGYLSTYAVKRMGRLSLLVNVLIFFSVGLVYSIFVSYKLEISIWSAFLGSYRNAEQKLKNVTEKLRVKDSIKNVIGSANTFRSKIHRTAKAAYRPKFSKSDRAPVPAPIPVPTPMKKRGSSRKTSFSNEEEIIISPPYKDLEAADSTYNPIHPVHIQDQES